MGRVFTYSEIEAGLVPQTEDFLAAAKTFEAKTCEAIVQGLVDGAFIFGSVAGLLTNHSSVAPNRRSDIDCLIVIRDYGSVCIESLKGIARAVHESSRNTITAQPIVYQRTQLENGHIPGMHEIDPIFGTDLKGPGRYVLGNDPADYIRFPEGSAFTHFNGYVAQKRRKLHDGLAQEPETLIGMRTLQRFLELPLSVGRKAIQTMILDGHYRNCDFWAANKSQVIRVVTEELFPDDAVAITLMERLLRYDQAYNQLLSSTIAEKLTEAEYIAGLREIADYSSGIAWLNHAHRTLNAKQATR